MIYFIAGASGSGKTAIIPSLKEILDDSYIIYDFDDIGVPPNADKKWRQKSTEEWLQKLLKENKNICLIGQMVLGEILACPSASQLYEINFCLLDVSDTERIKRIKQRNTYGADQNMLNWAAWLRMHHNDPKWEKHVIQDDSYKELNFDRLNSVLSWETLANINILDTTGIAINKVAQSVANWIISRNDLCKPEFIPGSNLL